MPMPGQKVEIRIRNASSLDFDRVVVDFPETKKVSYGPVQAGGLSTYRAPGRAYRYARVEAHSKGRPYLFQPMDYAGENELAAGRHTYVLTVDKASNTLLIALESEPGA